MKFTEEQLTKIRESLSASGIPDDVVEFTISDISADEEESTESKEENKQGEPTEEAEEANPADQPTENDESEEAPVDQQLGEEAPVEAPVAEEVPPAPEEQLPPPAEEVPPVEEVPAEQQVGGYDDSALRGLIQDLTTELEETKKANDGLLARVDSLEEALKKGGFLEDSEAPVGDETPKAPAQVPVDDPMDDILSQINGHKY